MKSQNQAERARNLRAGGAWARGQFNVDFMQVERAIFDKVHLFAEIQAGPAPLTPDEIRKLKAKRPAFYAFIPEPKEN